MWRAGALVSRRSDPESVRHALAQLNSLPRGDAEEVGDPPDQVTLEIVDAAVGIGDLPHHFDHAAAAILVERAIDRPGEMIEIYCVVLGLRRLGHQFAKAIEHAAVSRWTAPRCTSPPQSLGARYHRAADLCACL